jgi:siroheme synthase (precorrin-2 oxidase/ferrochelatase)
VVSDGTVYSNAIADRVDTVLQQATGLKETVHVNELRREQVMGFVEDDAGRSYAHLVMTYRSEAYA